MELGKFLEQVIKCKIVIANTRIYKRPHLGGYIEIPAAFTDALANLTEKIDYGCQFDETGKCKGTARPYKCCCHGCVQAFGYIHFMHHYEVAEYAKAFDEKDGFWRPKTGCVLPRSMRSTTCLTYRCHFSKPDGTIQRLTPQAEAILTLLSHVGDTYSDYINWRQHMKLGSTGCFNWDGSIIEYVDAWVERLPERLYSLLCTWREYYEKNPDISKQVAVERG